MGAWTLYTSPTRSYRTRDGSRPGEHGERHQDDSGHAPPQGEEHHGDQGRAQLDARVRRIEESEYPDVQEQ
jgi:hypothetical protein